MDYGIKLNGSIYTPNQTAVSSTDNDARNAELERAELAIWADRPDRFTAYFDFPNDKSGGPYRRSFCPSIVDARVKTWPGTVIGRIVDARVFEHNFGGRVVWLSVVGSNGANYHGRASWDNGNVITLRKVKG